MRGSARSCWPGAGRADVRVREAREPDICVVRASESLSRAGGNAGRKSFAV